MATFEKLWEMLYNHGATNYYKHDCCELWEGLSPEQQEELFETISVRLREGKFVHYNPLQAIQTNIRQPLRKEPTNYNGRRMPDEACVIAVYKGEGGVYTEREAKQFGMEIKKKL